MEIKACKCGGSPRVRTSGSYVIIYCRECGYNIGPYLNNTLSDIIKDWNESTRDREQQKKAAANFDNLLEYCNSTKGTPAEDKPVPKHFFAKIFGN